MAPKKNARPVTPRPVTPSAAATTQASEPEVAPSPVPKKSESGSKSKNFLDWFFLLQGHWAKETPQRTKLIDIFLLFLVAVGAIQFVYCVLAGNYPFNAFLSGFSATVGQFVLTISLRIQSTKANEAEFPSVSPERAFADFVVCSLILHFFCINFIN
ncbi:DAD family protein [Thelonectria olida]|uniref:Dolichyl-diphosphooligosaccharide--protein glycosyltransferase subunit OST2 n=1 Tax=Thelonectria olida TaxID=1576542 RepID=A0A9P9AVL0_9HYPO|nr:DAD family protein [Thelonectria olida]